MISNNVTDADSVRILIDLDGTNIFDGIAKKISYADQYSIFQFKMNKGRNSLKVTLPRFNVSDEISIDLIDRVALDVNLYYDPIKDSDVLSALDSTYNKASVELRELKGTDFEKLYSLDHVLLKD